jgi:hypothetical protein
MRNGKHQYEDQGNQSGCHALFRCVGVNVFLKADEADKTDFTDNRLDGFSICRRQVNDSLK